MEQSTAEVPKHDENASEEAPKLPEQDGSVESAAAALLALDESEDATPQGQAESQEAEPAESEKQAPPEVKPAALTLKIGEKEYEIPIPADTPEEVQQLVKDGLLMRADYSRKTMEVAESRKAVEAKGQELHQALQTVMQAPAHLAAIRNVDAQLQQLQDPQLWQRLQMEDPTGLRVVQAKQAYQDLLNQRQSLYGELERAHQQVTGTMKKQAEERMQAALPEVKKHIPDFGPEKVKAMRDFAKSLGATDEALDSIYDAAPLVILNMAMEYQKLQSQKPIIQQKVEKLPPKVQRPGVASDTSAPKINQAAAQRLKQSGSVDDAAAVLLSMMKD